MEASQREALQRFFSGGFVLLLDVPPNTEFGIDYKVFKTGPNFRGVKMIPPGLHFVFYSAGDGGFRQGMFVSLDPGDVLVRRWDAAAEDLSPGDGLKGDLDETEYQRVVASVRRMEFDAQMAPYDMDGLDQWQSLSKYIKSSVLQRARVPLGCRLMPGDVDEDSDTLHALEQAQTHIQSQSQAQTQTKTEPPTETEAQTHTQTQVLPRSSKQTPEALVPFFPDLARCVTFTDVQGARRPPGLRGGEAALSQYHLDRSARLSELLQQVFEERQEDLLGELQLAFVVFVWLGSMPGLTVWKQASEDFFEDEVSRENFLRPSLAALAENMNEYIDKNMIEDKMLAAYLSLLSFLGQRFSLRIPYPASIPHPSLGHGDKAKKDTNKYKHRNQHIREHNDSRVEDKNTVMYKEEGKLKEALLQEWQENDLMDVEDAPVVVSEAELRAVRAWGIEKEKEGERAREREGQGERESKTRRGRDTDTDADKDLEGPATQDVYEEGGKDNETEVEEAERRKKMEDEEERANAEAAAHVLREARARRQETMTHNI